MTQTAVPINDTLVGGWSEGAGDGGSDAFDELDETVAAADDATTYWRSSNNPSSDPIRCGVTALVDPITKVGHVLKARCAKSGSGGRQIDIVVRLFEGAAQRAGASLSNISDAWQTISYTLSEAEANAIGDHGNLRIEVEANVSGGGAGRRLYCTAMELECPNVRRVFTT